MSVINETELREKVLKIFGVFEEELADSIPVNIDLKKVDELLEIYRKMTLSEEQVQRAYMRSAVMSDFPNMIRVLTKAINDELLGEEQ